MEGGGGGGYQFILGFTLLRHTLGGVVTLEHPVGRGSTPVSAALEPDALTIRPLRQSERGDDDERHGHGPLRHGSQAWKSTVTAGPVTAVSSR